MPPGRAPFYTRGIIWTFFLATIQNHFNNFGRGPGIIPKFGQILISVAIEKKPFEIFLKYINVKLWPPGRGQFWPQEHNLNNFGKGPLDDAIY